MDMQPVRWWNGQTETTRRLGSALAVCGVVVGALYIIVQTGPTEQAMRIFDGSGRIVVGGAASPDRTTVNKSQVAVDASPAGQLMSVPVPQPSPFAATRSNAAAKKIASRLAVDKTRQAASGSVEHFDRCLPQCETRDPLIADHQQYAPAEPSVMADNDLPPQLEERVRFHPLADARHLWVRAVDAPGVMLRRGREAFDNVAGANW